MTRYRLASRASLDVSELLLAIGAVNRTAARKLKAGLFDTFRTLGRNPDLGERRGEIRIFTHRQLVICYRPGQTGVEILRVVHGARDWQQELGG